MRSPLIVLLAALHGLVIAGALAADVPLTVKNGDFVSPRGYVSSDRCQSCHPKQYASWHRSYHRTMTQSVSPETVVADFDASLPKTYGLEQRDDKFWARFPDGAERQIIQSTGSHHYQLYWYSSGVGNELRMFPFVWLKADARWAPRISVFLTPPNQAEEPIVWNYHCLPCHSTDGSPGYVPQAEGPAKPETRVAELGIACEACHGPGAEHVEDEAANGMVHPAKISAERSAEVCGQCHSVNIPKNREGWADWMLDGPVYKAGEALRDSRQVIDRHTAAESPLIQQLLSENPTQLDEWFWSDGEVRVTGREYNALIRSPCFQGGEFSCLSCHSPHADDPDDLLRVSRGGNDGCVQCHGKFAGEALTRHTRHEADSPGSRCYNCHMPNTVYGLLKATRSHEITSPTAVSDVQSGRPNACSLCHLDRPVGWAAKQLAEGWGVDPPELSERQQTLAAGPVGLLTGDAGQRALWAWHMGWPSAQQASKAAWMPPFLVPTLADPYDVVRYIALRSLRTISGFGDYQLDFVSVPSQPQMESAGVEPEGAPIPYSKIRELLLERDDRPVKLAE